MPNIKAEVHVYASGRQFVVVPVSADPAGGPIEANSVERVNVVLGRATVVDLTRALRETQRQSLTAWTGEDGNAAVPWDGDNGRWWAHNLLFVVLHWDENELTLSRQERGTGGDWTTVDVTRFPGDAPFADVAQELVRALGEQLHR